MPLDTLGFRKRSVSNVSSVELEHEKGGERASIQPTQLDVSDKLYRLLHRGHCRAGGKSCEAGAPTVKEARCSGRSPPHGERRR